MAVFFMILAGPALTAQTDVRVVVVPRVRIYLGPVENGTAEEIEYFTNSMTMEFTASGYQMADSREGSDYNLAMEIERPEPEAEGLEGDFEDPQADEAVETAETADEEPLSSIRMALFETKSGREIISQTWEYRDFTEMDQWNLYAITQMMANTPVIKITPDAEMFGVLEGGRAPDGGPHRMAFYLGLRAGGVFDLSFIQNSGGYEGGVGRGFGGEGALLAEFHLFRYLSLQTGAGLIYDTFSAGRIVQTGGEEIRSTGSFQSLSLMAPLWIKIPVTMDRFVLSPFAGGYFLAPLAGKPGPHKLEPPLGLGLGFEWGIPINSHMLSAGLRFDYDIGLSSAGEDRALQYSRMRMGLFAGYKFRLWRAGERSGTGAPL
jgi:hypothetical protein